MLEKTYNNHIEESIKKNWHISALSDYKKEAVSYGAVAKKILNLYAFFESAGIKEGDKVALIGKNSTNWAIVYLAVSTYGAVIVPLLPDFRPFDAQNIIDHSEAKLLFASSQHIASLKADKMPKIKGILSLEDFSLFFDYKGLLKKNENKQDRIFNKKYKKLLSPEKFKLPQIANSNLLEILYTSGTSGASKGVMLSHNSITANILFGQQNLELNPSDPILSFLPLAHAYGCAFEFLFPFSRGAHITFLGKIPAPKLLIKAFKEIKPRVILMVPLIIEKIYKKQLKPKLDQMPYKMLLKLPIVKNKIYKEINKKLTKLFGGNFDQVVIGGAALNKEVEQFLRKIEFKYTVGYGMTECGPLISYITYKKTRFQSCGKVIQTLKIKLDKEKKKDKVGEILLKGENVMDGYYKNEIATNDAFDKDGWLRTGDLGEIDKDGYIYIRGRNKSMILGASGQNIYPEEIEAILNNMPLVMESLVVEQNEQLTALIYPDQDTIDKNELDEKYVIKEIKNYKKIVNKKLPAFMRISNIEIINKEFEKTPKKSIKRFIYTTPNNSFHSINTK